MHTRGLFLFMLLSVFTRALADDLAPCPCQNACGKEVCCFVGALEIPIQDPEVQQLWLYYDGTLVKVSDGVYCFKERRDVSKLHILFVDPQHIRYANDENTIYRLTLTNDAPYDFYELTRATVLWERTRTAHNWHLKHKKLQKQLILKDYRLVVPEHTIIIPLSSDFFEKNRDSHVAFSYQSLSDTETLVRLPSPTIAKKFDAKEFKEALLQAHMCIMNLKSTHAAPEQSCVRMDSHTMIQ